MGLFQPSKFMLLFVGSIVICGLNIEAHKQPNFFGRRLCKILSRRCPKVYAPVCGCDGVTYINECIMSKINCRIFGQGRKISVAHQGKCIEDYADRDCDPNKACIEIYQPVCGSDSKTYSNGCYMELANCKRPKGSPAITRVYMGECKSERECDRIPCTKIYAPVCGSDGRTYSNDCTLSVENCRRKEAGRQMITQLYEGECRGQSECDLIACTKIYAPVCGSDGKTYSNDCVFSIENCKRREAGRPLITQAYNGECRSQTTLPTTFPPACNDVCIQLYEPVCGSDGNTYGNTCFLDIANCRRATGGRELITVEYKGECFKTTIPTTITPPVVCNDICIQVYDPLCGSDGNTYSNTCFLGVTNCRRAAAGLPPVTQVSPGECAALS